MNNNPTELEHWGIKGMKWGRRRFQNKDGTLTPEGKKRYADDSDDEVAKTAERRERALKSSNAEEVYNNRDVLTTAEIRERLDRINVERQLAAVAASTKTTGMDRAKAIVDKANDIYKMANTPAAAAARKALIGAVKTKPVPKKLKDIYDNMDDVVSTLSDADLKKYSDRANSERNFKQTLKELYKKDPARRSLKDLYDDRDNVSDKDLKDAFARATTERNIKKILDEQNAKTASETATKPKSETVSEEPEKKTQTKAEYSTDGINWKEAYVDTGNDFVTNSTWDVSSGSKEANQLSESGWDFVQKAFYDPPEEYLKQGDLHMGNDELCHHGVKGMKWGVRRARRKQERNERLANKALNLDRKSATLNKKAEKAHAKYDLERRNIAAVKSAKYAVKGAKFEKKAHREENTIKSLTYSRKAARLKYKSAKYKIKGDRMSLTTGYGTKAMKYKLKSDKAAMKAAKARRAIATNERFIALMEMRMSEVQAA